MVNYVGAEKPDLLELSHYGVKGMKWGRRRAVAKKADKLKARDPNKALVREKLMVSGIQAAKAGGFGKAALKNRQKSIARKTRVADGNAKTLEILAEFGSLSLADLVRG